MSEKTVSELATHVGGEVIGEDSIIIRRIADIKSAGEGDIAFIEDLKFAEQAKVSKAACLIVPKGFQVETSCSLIETAKPKLAFALIAKILHPPKKKTPLIHPSAVISERAKIDSTAFIGAHVCIGENSSIGAITQINSGAQIGDNVSIGDDCMIHPNVVVYDNVTIGNGVILHAGVVIGADGFGYVRGADGYQKFPQIGIVIIEDDVEIGANSCIDRGALGETRIGRGTKIDNLVQIAHNDRIGERVLIAALSGISGSATVEDDVILAGQVGIADHTHIERGAMIGAKSAVFTGKKVRSGIWCGVPVMPLEKYKKLNAQYRGLIKMSEEVNALRTEVEKLKEELNRKNK